MELKKYIAASEKQYHLRLKSIKPIDDVAMDAIEMVVAKYVPLKISKPFKTIVQRHPMDFANIPAAEVYIIDFTFGLPAAPHVVREDIRAILRAPEDYIVVRDTAEPVEIETVRLNAIADIAAEAERLGLTPAPVLGDPEYGDERDPVSDWFGNAYNSAFLGHLAAVRAERLDKADRVANAPFNWLDLPDAKDEGDVHGDFNADVAGAPVLFPEPELKLATDLSILGSFDDKVGEVRRVFVNNKGERVVLTRKLGSEDK